MKKVLFCLQTLVRGGVEKELLTILKLFPREQYDIDCVIFYTSDEEIDEKLYNSNVNFINLSVDKDFYCSNAKTVLKKRLQRGKLLQFGKILIKRMFSKEYIGSLVSIKDVPEIEKEYDIAVCYHMHSPIVVKYVAQKIRAQKKLLWMHNDFESSGFDPRYLKKYLGEYSLIAGCSKKVTDEFCKFCPEYKPRAKTVYNLVDIEEIQTLSQERISDMPSAENETVLLTVGRYSPEKGYADAISACKMLIDSGYKIKWYCMGAGNFEDEMGTLIERNNLEESFILLGTRDNPYPYMNECDIYVQPSIHEGFGLTIAEAKVLGKTIVCTDFTGAREQLEDAKTATIVPVAAPEALMWAIADLIDNPEKRELYVKNLLNAKDFNNPEALLECFE